MLLSDDLGDKADDMEDTGEPVLGQGIDQYLREHDDFVDEADDREDTGEPVLDPDLERYLRQQDDLGNATDDKEDTGLVERLAQRAWLREYDPDEEGIDIIGDKIEYLKESGIMIGEGNVVIRFEGVEIRGDHIIYNNNDNIATAKGRVFVRKPDGTTYSGEAAVYNFNTNLLEARLGEMFTFPFYGKGATVEKVQSKPEREKYVIKDGYITTCGLDAPEYRISASRFHVYPRDKVIAFNAIIFIRKMPVLYLPIYVHWLEDRPPIEVTWGRSSSMGHEVLTRYNYKIGEHVKGALRYDWREWKGSAYGVDLKYESKTSRGLYSFYFLEEKDKQIEDIPSMGAGGEIRARDRWRHKFQHQEWIGEDIDLWIQLYKVKDENVLRDYYEKEYGGRVNPETFVYVNKYHDMFSARVLFIKKINKWFTQIQKLPEIDFDIIRTPIYDSGVFINYRFNAVKYKRDVARQIIPGIEDHTDRAYSEIEFSRPFSVTSWLHAFPYIRFDETYYTDDLNDNDRFRHVSTAGIEFNSKFWNVYDYENEFWEINKIRHVIEPSLDILYRGDPGVESDELFQYDIIDTREAGSRVRFRLDTRLQTKRENVGSQWVKGRVEKAAFYDPEDMLKLINADLIAEDPSDDLYFIWRYKNMKEDEFLDIINELDLSAPDEIIMIWQDTHDQYESNKEFQGMANKTATLLDYYMYMDWLPEEGGHNFSDIFSELRLTPVSWLTIGLDYRYDTMRMDFRSVNPSLSFSFFDNWSVSGGWRYVYPDTSSLSTSVSYQPNKKWGFSYSQEYNFEDNYNHVPSKSFVVSHNGHCGITKVTITQRRDERRVENVVWYEFYLKAFPEETIETKAFRYTQIVETEPL